MVLRPAKRDPAWSIGVDLVLTGIVLLAHWTTDVIAGSRSERQRNGCSDVGRVSDRRAGVCRILEMLPSKSAALTIKTSAPPGRLRSATPRPRN